jgi:hypothetical protein
MSSLSNKNVSDTNIKKVVLPATDLPGFAVLDGGFTVRYRIITEDRNQFSEWSPFYFLPILENQLIRANFINDTVNGGQYIRTIGSNKVLDLLWNDLSFIGIREYDIFLKIGSNEWKYQTTTTNNSANIGLGPFLGPLNARVLISTPQKNYVEELVLFKMSNENGIIVA